MLHDRHGHDGWVFRVSYDACYMTVMDTMAVVYRVCYDACYMTGMDTMAVVCRVCYDACYMTGMDTECLSVVLKERKSATPHSLLQCSACCEQAVKSYDLALKGSEFSTQSSDWQ
jgi:hypothetical protein